MNEDNEEKKDDNCIQHTCSSEDKEALDEAMLYILEILSVRKQNIDKLDIAA